MPTSVWTTHASQKSFSSSVANATSKVVVSPGESRTLMKSSPTRWKRFDLGAMILTACGRESALRSVTSAVYTVSASASLKHTAGETSGATAAGSTRPPWFGSPDQGTARSSRTPGGVGSADRRSNGNYRGDATSNPTDERAREYRGARRSHPFARRSARRPRVRD